jgi:diguanylate cyclase
MPFVFDPNERFIRRTVLFLLFAGVLGGVMATTLHLMQPQPHLVDLIVPPVMTVVLLGLLIHLYRSPSSFMPVIWTGFFVGLLGIAIPAWIYTITAWRNPGLTLVGTLPPITSLLLPLLMGMIVFLRPRQMLTAACVAWLLVAAPILIYLAFHHQELWSPRGLDMVITLGPVMLMVVIFIPFQRGVEKWVIRLKRERAQAQALAERDALTGLYNRRAGESFLANLLAAPDPSDALILFDIDRFKTINDTHGHPVGDAVLREVAARCAALLRKSDVFARWGGEEFLILVRGSGEAGAKRVADDLRKAISAEPIETVGKVTASFGVSRFQNDDTLASWLKRADEGLYEAKETGRDRVVGR